MKFLTHAIFRDSANRQVLPNGLQWDMDGTTYMAYLPLDDSLKGHRGDITSNPDVRKGLVAAHNLFAFARGSDLVSDADLKAAEVLTGGTHVHVLWATPERMPVVASGSLSQVTEALRSDSAATDDSARPAAVYVNGIMVGTLAGPGTAEGILARVQPEAVHSRNLRLRRSESGSILSVERQFYGGIRGEEVFEHLMDNLYAMEDAKVVDRETILGTATLPDWIMGGMLTSRVWVQDTGDRILALRPLYNDDLSSSDRKYQLVQGKSADDDRRMAAIREMMDNIRVLANTPHPGKGKPEKKLALRESGGTRKERGDRCRQQ